MAELTDLPPQDCELVATPTESGSGAAIGFNWNGTEFVNPDPVVPESPGTDQ